MSTPSKGSKDEDDTPWVGGRTRPKPSAIEADVCDVSRESGLINATTFGGADRFSAKVTAHGASSPVGREYYSRNQLYKLPHESGLTCTQGIGDRPSAVDMAVPPQVGPGSYEILASVAKRRSPLDGPEYCSASIHKKLPSSLVPANLCSPGPHHSYQVRKPLDGEKPTYKKAALSHGGRHPFPEDLDGPGFKNNDAGWNGVAKSASTPDLGASPDGKTPKRMVKCTFGTADRFRAGKQSCSPQKNLYYAHSKFLTSEDYLASSRSCSFGAGQKTDFSNPYRGHRSQISPTDYSPCLSQVRKTSAVDGMASRCTSPVHAHARAAQAKAPLGQSMRSLGGSMGSPMRSGKGMALTSTF